MICLLGLSFGAWRGGQFQQRLTPYQALYLHKITLRLSALNDGVYGKTSQMTFDAGRVILEDGQRLTGKLQISGFGVNAVFQGDELEVSGKLYEGYGVYQGRISFGKLVLIAHHDSLLSNTKRRFAAGLQSALPEPHAPFAMGLLVGQRATLPDEPKQDLLMVGLTHIIAVSGYNLTIILHASRRLIGSRSKRLGTLLCLGLITIFVLLTGASASIVRAAIVSVLSIGASYYGRSFKPLNLIALAAVITACVNPVYIWSDLSWYLSFLAFFGVMVVSPLLAARLPSRWHDSLLIGVALESICAEITTLPFVLHIFGQMSRIGLLANVLVVSLIPLAMALSAIAGLAGMFFAAQSGWLSWPANILLTYMLDVAHALAKLPHIFIEGIGLSTGQMLALYGLTIFMIWLLGRKTNMTLYAKITDKKLVIHAGEQ